MGSFSIGPIWIWASPLHSPLPLFIVRVYAPVIRYIGRSRLTFRGKRPLAAFRMGTRVSPNPEILNPEPWTPQFEPTSLKP